MKNLSPLHAESRVSWLAHTASACLIDEARLSPKPGLVDSRGNGAHQDLNLALMERSARSLQPTFHALAEQSWRRPADIALRETVGRLGREGEAQMMLATGGVNTHRGAIWALGLLVSAVAMLGGEGQSQAIADAAAALARLPDGFAPKSFSKGLRASRRWQVPGAREEAQCGFPHITRLALPQLQHSRARGASEPQAQLDALMAIMTSLSDTCVLSRAGMAGLQAMQQGACEVLAAGGCASFAGRAALARLDAIAGAKRLAGRRRRSPCRHPVSRQSCRLTHSEDVMEQITLSFPASRALSGRALAGVVGSGDMEVLYTAAQSATLNVQITTSVDNSQARWQALFDRLNLINGLPAGQLIIHDFGATPGVARIRIEQVFEEAAHA